MPDFTIETTYHLPVWRHRTYSAVNVAAACRLAVEDKDWTAGKFDHDSAGETFVTGIWPGSGTAYSSAAIAVPAHFGEILGIRFKTRAVRLYGGGTRDDPRIYFTGFWSQGDGACFEAWYAHAKGAPRQIRKYAPKDATLHQIADDLAAVQRRNFYQLRAETTQRGHYYHANCMSVSVERDSPTWQGMTVGAEDAVIEALRDLARWLYRQLECEYGYLTSDEAVDETIAANEYTFTATGHRFG